MNQLLRALRIFEAYVFYELRGGVLTLESSPDHPQQLAQTAKRLLLDAGLDDGKGRVVFSSKDNNVRIEHDKIVWKRQTLWRKA